ncbi:hypothetical protein ASC87_06545 [Rhizobacter sp. Root1221]|nr:hypothetical protein ASC87_06545 [Rhizobacter sp. Root1221]
MGCLALLVATGAARAGDIYRWVDEQGRTHMADTVPERYKRTARHLDGRKYELSPAEQAAAAAALERTRAEQAEADARRAAAPDPAPSVRAPGGKAAGSKVEDNSGSECDRLWRQYYASQACFGPWQTTPQAHARCKETVSPAARCGVSGPPADARR